MKAILEFELMDDFDMFQHATKGSTYYIVIDEIADLFRKHLKYNTKEYNEDQLEAIKWLKDEFYSILSDYEVTI